jgi:hypothetical protein
VIGGYIAGAILAVSGAAGVLIPQQIGPVIETPLSKGRATAEFRVAYGAMGGVGVWALIAGDAEVFKAVGALWFAAAAVRLVALAVDRPRPNTTYWAFLALEVGLGLVAFLGS